jgi:SlyX protein
LAPHCRYCTRSGKQTAPEKTPLLRTKKKDTMENRLTDLEVKITYNEHLIDELNRTVYRQQQQIDWLIGEIRSLRDQIKNAPNEPRSLRDEIPPHY